MSFKQRENSEDWLSLADLSMGGFIIFLVLTMIFITRVPKQNSSEGTLKNITDALKEKIKNNPDVEVIENENGAIRFTSKENEELFKNKSPELSPTFQKKLDNFLVLYFEIIKNYQDEIAEIRIEGHTDTNGEYMFNLKLSQERAFKVLEHIQLNKAYINLDDNLKETLNKSIIPIGYSYTKALDKNGNFINKKSKLPCDLDKSRRVEFKIFLKPSNE